jgi:hypothetical protein
MIGSVSSSFRRRRLLIATRLAAATTARAAASCQLTLRDRTERGSSAGREPSVGRPNRRASLARLSRLLPAEPWSRRTITLASGVAVTALGACKLPRASADVALATVSAAATIREAVGELSSRIDSRLAVVGRIGTAVSASASFGVSWALRAESLLGTLPDGGAAVVASCAASEREVASTAGDAATAGSAAAAGGDGRREGSRVSGST